METGTGSKKDVFNIIFFEFKRKIKSYFPPISHFFDKISLNFFFAEIKIKEH